MRTSYFTSRDWGHVQEIKRALEQVEKDYMLDLSSEKEWLNGLDERFAEPLTKVKPAEVVIGSAINEIKQIIAIKEEVARMGRIASENYERDLSDKEYWTYMTCKRITQFIRDITGESAEARSDVQNAVEDMLRKYSEKI